MIDPASVPEAAKRRLREVGLWEVDPINLFRVTWHNEPKERGGLFGGVNFLEIPREISIAGFDDFEWMQVMHPPVATVIQPVEELATAAWATPVPH
jgi:hypothetical protein